MPSTIEQAVEQDASWTVSREGSEVATIAVRQEQGEVVVVTGTSNTEKPYRFDTLQAADAFLSDLMTSFSYLGCDIATSST